MKKSVQVRDYKMSDASLIQLADAIMYVTDRDSAEFANRGWDASRLANLATARLTFNNYPTDTTQNGLRQIATEQKNIARDLLETATREIFVAVDTRFEGSSVSSMFGDRAISRFTDDDLARETLVVYDSAVMFASDLALEGITSAKLTAYLALRNDFDLKIDKLRRTEINRDASTDKRIELGNDLYRVLNKVCNVGKNIWYTVNEAKYNDYVIYDAPNNSTPTTVTVTLSPGDTGTYFTNNLQAATRLNISITAGMDKLAIYVADNKQGALPTNAAYALPLKPQDLTAGDISNGTLGNCFVVNIGNAPVSFTLTLL